MGRFLTNIRNDEPLTIPDIKTGDPLLKWYQFVFVSIALLKEARGAVLHWHQGDPERGQLWVGQKPVEEKEMFLITVSKQSAQDDYVFS